MKGNISEEGRQRIGLRLENGMKPMPSGVTTCAVGPGGSPRQEQQERVMHTLGAYQCTMELFFETNYLPGHDAAFRTVLKKFSLRIYDTVQDVTRQWTCKKSGNALLCTPYYCSGSEENGGGQRRALSRHFSWPKGQATEDVCREFIDCLQ